MKSLTYTFILLLCILLYMFIVPKYNKVQFEIVENIIDIGKIKKSDSSIVFF